MARNYEPSRSDTRWNKWSLNAQITKAVTGRRTANFVNDHEPDGFIPKFMNPKPFSPPSDLDSRLYGSFDLFKIHFRILAGWRWDYETSGNSWVSLVTNSPLIPKATTHANPPHQFSYPEGSWMVTLRGRKHVCNNGVCLASHSFSLAGSVHQGRAYQQKGSQRATEIHTCWLTENLCMIELKMYHLLRILVKVSWTRTIKFKGQITPK